MKGQRHEHVAHVFDCPKATTTQLLRPANNECHDPFASCSLGLFRHTCYDSLHLVSCINMPTCKCIAYTVSEHTMLYIHIPFRPP